jgi:hypothetical protein
MKSLILHNLGLKLASLFLAVLIWLVVHSFAIHPKTKDDPSARSKPEKIVPVRIAP